MAFSISQKLILGYASLVGVGGLIGYFKSGSGKSLVAGGSSAGVLYYVFKQLPQIHFVHHPLVLSVDFKCRLRATPCIPPVITIDTNATAPAGNIFFDLMKREPMNPVSATDMI